MILVDHDTRFRGEGGYGNQNRELLKSETDGL
jgi:hypothetical protein